MEVTKKAKMTTWGMGSTAYLSGDKVVQNWLESQQDRLLHPRYRELKDAIGNEDKLEQILNVFNTNGNNEPVWGNWMLKECSMNAQKLAGTWAKFKVSEEMWRTSVQFTPTYIPLYRGKNLIEQAERVEVYTITTQRGQSKGRSFLKAYQVIQEGAEFSFAIDFPEDLCTKTEGRGADKIFTADTEKTMECVNAVLDKMCIVGLGAYRLRYGKFHYIQ